MPRNSDNEPAAEVTRRILAERAAVFARVPVRQEASGNEIEIIEFMLAHEKYGIETIRLKEVHSLRELVRLPGAPAFIKGIMNVRGRIVAVIDLKVFFDLPDAGTVDSAKVMIIDSAEFSAGFLADAVMQVRRLPIADLQSSLPTLTGVRAEYLKGVTKDRVVVLDAARIIADEKLLVNEKVEA